MNSTDLLARESHGLVADSLRTVCSCRGVFVLVVRCIQFLGLAAHLDHLQVADGWLRFAENVRDVEREFHLVDGTRVLLGQLKYARKCRVAFAV